MPRIHTTISNTDSTLRLRAASVDCGQTAPRAKAPYKKRDDAAVLVNRDLQRHADALHAALSNLLAAFANTPTSALTKKQLSALARADEVVNPDK